MAGGHRHGRRRASASPGCSTTSTPGWPSARSRCGGSAAARRTSGQNRANALLRDVLDLRLDIARSTTRDRPSASASDGFVSACSGRRRPGDRRRRRSWSAPGSASTSATAADEPAHRTRQSAARPGHRAAGRATSASSAARAPVVILLEDLHWADEARCAGSTPPTRLLRDCQVLVVAHDAPLAARGPPALGRGTRPPRAAPAPPALAPREPGCCCTRSCSTCRTCPPTLVDLVVDAAEGNPFYIEELVTWLPRRRVVVRGEPHWHVVDELVALGRRYPPRSGASSSPGSTRSATRSAACCSGRRSSAGCSGTTPSPTSTDGARCPATPRVLRHPRPAPRREVVYQRSSRRSTPPASSCSSTPCCATSPTTACCAAHRAALPPARRHLAGRGQRPRRPRRTSTPR